MTDLESGRRACFEAACAELKTLLAKTDLSSAKRAAIDALPDTTLLDKLVPEVANTIRGVLTRLEIQHAAELTLDAINEQFPHLRRWWDWRPADQGAWA